MAAKVFVDTDVVIDHLTDREPFSIYSSILFELHEQGQIQIHVSALSISNIYYFSRKLIGKKRTLLLLEQLIDTLEIVATSKSEIKTALAIGFKDFEDGLQYASALNVKGIDVLVTRNVKDYRRSKIAVFTPEIYINTKLKTK